MGIIFTIIILGIIVFIHELGHFATAKYFGMPVTEFAIGMGPRIFSVKKNGMCITIFFLLHLKDKSGETIMKGSQNGGRFRNLAK